MKASPIAMPTIGEEDIAPFVPLADEEARVRRFAQNLFRRFNPGPVISEEMEVAEERLVHARHEEQRTFRQRRSTPLYRAGEEPDPDAKSNPIESAFGKFGLAVLIAALFVVPGIAAMLIIEAGKIAVVADVPAFGLVFGITALVGILAAIEWRGHLVSDNARSRFDRRLLAATIAVFLAWSLIMALAAYPADFSGSAIDRAAESRDWSLPVTDTPEPAASGFRIESPMWLLFFATALLDLLAAPTLHHFAVRRLAPRPVKRISPDAEQDHLVVNAGPEAAAEVNDALEELSHLRTADQLWQAAMESFEERAVALLKVKTAEVEAARSAAVAQVLYAAPRRPGKRPHGPNGRHPSQQPAATDPAQRRS